jgi:AraC family transcriptional regulator of adaptative response/methylated-DNA-[protein]-cysteine methyltransferase
LKKAFFYGDHKVLKDYERIARAIDYIRSHASEQPSLERLAAHVNLSEYHFQRLFSRWAGVTPKRYLQILTLEHAKHLLRAGLFSALNVSYEVGLSSASRLYDHFVQIDAVTPSEYRQRGRGLTIVFGYHKTCYGVVFVALTSRGICQLDFVEPDAQERPLQLLLENWSNAEVVEDLNQTLAVVERLFSSNVQNSSPISVWVRGTNFQLSVWRALLNIQQGDVVSYGDIAQIIGRPKAYRAVGTAIGSNPVGLVIPCHRVLRRSGELGGYRWGETRKHVILAREAALSEQCEYITHPNDMLPIPDS